MFDMNVEYCINTHISRKNDPCITSYLVEVLPVNSHPKQTLSFRKEHRRLRRAVRKLILDNRDQAKHGYDSVTEGFVITFVNNISARTLALAEAEFGENPEGIIDWFQVTARYSDGTNYDIRARELMMFRRELYLIPDTSYGSITTNSIKLLNDLRVSAEKFRREDLSEVTHMMDARAVLKTAALLVDEEFVRCDHHTMCETPYMSASLAQVVMKHPDKIEDIVDRLKTLKLRPDLVDKKSLLDYLEHPAQVMRDGVL